MKRWLEGLEPVVVRQDLQVPCRYSMGAKTSKFFTEIRGLQRGPSGEYARHLLFQTGGREERSKAHGSRHKAGKERHKVQGSRRRAQGVRRKLQGRGKRAKRGKRKRAEGKRQKAKSRKAQVVRS